MEEMMLVLTNAPDDASAMLIAEELVTSRAAACVNCLPAVQSVYRWRGQLERSREVTLFIKTPGTNYPEVERLIIKHHPYELPEIVALPITAGLPSYLQWISDETMPSGSRE